MNTKYVKSMNAHGLEVLETYLHKHCEVGMDWSMEEWGDDVCSQAENWRGKDGSIEVIGYEIQGRYTEDGNPAIVVFDADCFNWADAEEGEV